MPVERFSDPNDARSALWIESDDPNLPARIRALWGRAARLSASMIPRGLRRFRTIEEAGIERQEWEAARIRWVAAQRAGKARHPQSGMPT